MYSSTISVINLYRLLSYTFTYLHKVKILVTVITEPIEFSILAKLYIGSGMS